MPDLIKRAPFVIVESPYAGDIARNVLYARACLLDSIRRGEAPFASHLLYPQVLDEYNPEDRAQGITLGHEVMVRADLVVFYTDLGWSPGMSLAAGQCDRFNKDTETRTLGEWENLSPEGWPLP